MNYLTWENIVYTLLKVYKIIISNKRIANDDFVKQKYWTFVQRKYKFNELCGWTAQRLRQLCSWHSAYALSSDFVLLRTNQQHYQTWNVLITLFVKINIHTIRYKRTHSYWLLHDTIRELRISHLFSFAFLAICIWL